MLFCAALLCALCLPSACVRPAQRKPPPCAGFEAPVTLRQNDFTCSGTLSCRSPEEIVFSVSEPAGIAGTLLSLTPEGVWVRIGEKEDLLSPQALPGGAPALLLLYGVRQFAFSSPAYEQTEDGGFTASAEIGGALLTAGFAPDGALRSLSDGNGFSALFGGAAAQPQTE